MICVIGDCILDEYWFGTSTRLSPEAPVPVVDKHQVKLSLGGAANVAANLHSLGSPVMLITSIGNDDNGQTVRDMFQFPTKLTISPNTVHKLRIYSNDQCIVRVDQDSQQFQVPHPDWNEFDAAIVSDYNKGTIGSISAKHTAKIFVDPKKSFDHYQGTFLIKPNLKEFSQFVGDGNNIKQTARDCLNKNNIEWMMVTKGKDGIDLIGKDTFFHINAPAIGVVDVSGAGDTVIAAFVHEFVRSQSMVDAAEFAVKAAAVAVQHHGTYVVSPSDFSPALKVFTNGCFDLLHEGHLEVLKYAKSLGGEVIVGLNSDSSVRRLKGNSRPIQSQETRKSVLESLSYVDKVIIFDQDTPLELIEHIKPDIIVKGGDYKLEQVIGNHISEVRIVPTKDGHSTTGLVERIQDATNGNTR